MYMPDFDIFRYANRFNRYMVECEFEKKIKMPGTGVCFNRYMVECE